MRTTLDMWATCLTVIPAGIVLGLLAFGHHGGPRLHATPRHAALVGLAAVLVGPVAVAVLGPLLWLLCVAVVVGVLTTTVVLRTQRQPLPR